jgi:hypothetical protein
MLRSTVQSGTDIIRVARCETPGRCEMSGRAPESLSRSGEAPTYQVRRIHKTEPGHRIKQAGVSPLGISATDNPRTVREAAARCQSVPGRFGKPLHAVSLFPNGSGSHCTLSVCSRTVREATVRCQSVPGRFGKPLYAVSLFPNGSGSKCHPTFCSRTVRDANVTLHSVPARCETQMSPYILFPHGAGSKCHPTFRSRTFREATARCQPVAGRSAKPFNSLRGRDSFPGWHPGLSGPGTFRCHSECTKPCRVQYIRSGLSSDPQSCNLNSKLYEAK